LWWLISEIEAADAAEASPDDILIAVANYWQVPTWLKEQGDFGVKYSHAFLWGASMVTSTVPYDVMPVTTAENWVTTFSMFFGLIFNAVVISSLTTALTSMNSKKELAGKQLDTIRTYLVLKAVPADLRSRILEYYEYLFTSSQMLASSIRYETLPPNLAAQLALSINRKVAARCAFFREISNACMVSLISELQPVIFVPAQLIVFEGHPLTAVFFINRGLVQLLERAQPIGTLRDNENFGLDDYLSAVELNEPPTVSFTAKAVGYCDVMTLGIDKLAEAVLQDDEFQKRVRDHTLGDKSMLKEKAGKKRRMGGHMNKLLRSGACGMSSSRDVGKNITSGDDEKSDALSA
jgi:hypothetical protein